jgi:spore maturation protein CgeB
VPRLRGLERAGLRVHQLDVDWPTGHTWLTRQLAYRTYVTPSVMRMNLRLVEAVRKHRPDVVWIDKGCWIYPPMLRALRRYARFVVQYNTDDIWGNGTPFWLARLGLDQYDVHLTTNRHNVIELRRRGLQAIRAGMGYDGELPELAARAKTRFHGVVFIGHWEPHTETYVVALRRAGIPVRVWGGGWKHARSSELREVSSLPQQDYVPTLAGAAIALCSLSRINRNESTGRTFEIPAVGTCLLAERTDEHAFLYRDERDALLFTGTEELIDKARRYLGDSASREAIARTGRERCGSLGLSWEEHIVREWGLVEHELLNKSPSVEVDKPFWTGFRSGDPPPAIGG